MSAQPTLAVVGATGAVGTVHVRAALVAPQRLGRDPAGRVARARPAARIIVRGEELTSRS